MIYETAGHNPVWDGKIKNTDAPVGVYYYIIKTSATSEVLKGSILIIR